MGKVLSRCHRGAHRIAALQRGQRTHRIQLSDQCRSLFMATLPARRSSLVETPWEAQRRCCSNLSCRIGLRSQVAGQRAQHALVLSSDLAHCTCQPKVETVQTLLVLTQATGRCRALQAAAQARSSCPSIVMRRRTTRSRRCAWPWIRVDSAPASALINSAADEEPVRAGRRRNRRS